MTAASFPAFAIVGEQRSHILRQRGGEVQRRACERVGKPELRGVERGPGDARVPRALKPIPSEGEAERRHVYAQLVRAARAGDEAQEREAA